MARKSDQPDHGVLAAFRDRRVAGSRPAPHPLFDRRVLFEPEVVVPDFINQVGVEGVSEELGRSRAISPFKPGCPISSIKRRAIKDWQEAEAMRLARAIHNPEGTYQ